MTHTQTTSPSTAPEAEPIFEGRVNVRAHLTEDQA